MKVETSFRLALFLFDGSSRRTNMTEARTANKTVHNIFKQFQTNGIPWFVVSVKFLNPIYKQLFPRPPICSLPPFFKLLHDEQNCNYPEKKHRSSSFCHYLTHFWKNRVERYLKNVKCFWQLSAHINLELIYLTCKVNCATLQHCQLLPVNKGRLKIRGSFASVSMFWKGARFYRIFSPKIKDSIISHS